MGERVQSKWVTTVSGVWEWVTTAGGVWEWMKGYSQSGWGVGEGDYSGWGWEWVKGTKSG